MNSIKSRITEDNDWREGVNAYRKWTDSELEKIVKDIHEIKVAFVRFKHIIDYFETWKKRNQQKEETIKGESL